MFDELLGRAELKERIEELQADVASLEDQLAAEEARVRSQAARALGMLGDPRAVDPLGDVLADEEETEGSESRDSEQTVRNQPGLLATLRSRLAR
mgnify:CR=1 FL=1